MVIAAFSAQLKSRLSITIAVIALILVSCTFVDESDPDDEPYVVESHCVVIPERSVLYAPDNISVSIEIYVPEDPGIFYLQCNNRSDFVWTGIPGGIELNRTEVNMLRSRCRYAEWSVGAVRIYAGFSKGEECSVDIEVR
jgi:hypothetical protein